MADFEPIIFSSPVEKKNKSTCSCPPMGIHICDTKPMSFVVPDMFAKYCPKKGIVAENLTGLWGISKMWRCPSCHKTNRHNMPSNPEKKSYEEMMYGSSRVCDGCGCNYVLGPPSQEAMDTFYKNIYS